MSNLKSKCCGQPVLIKYSPLPNHSGGYFCAGPNGCGKYCEVEEKERKSVHNPCPYGNDDCPKCSSTQTDDWEKEFDRKISVTEEDSFMDDGYDDCGLEVNWDNLKSFIRQLLAKTRLEERQRVIEEIENYQMDLCENSLDFKNYVINLLK